MKKLLSLFLFIYPFSLVAQEDTLTLLFAGDAMMHQTQLDNTKVGETFDLKDYFTQIEQEVKAADIAVVNLEVALGGKRYSGYPAFCAPDCFATTLQDAGFDFFLLANNHCLDRGARGLVRTLHVLDSLGIRNTGTFLDPDHRLRSYPMLLRKNGFRIIMLNYTYDTNGIRVKPPRIVNYIDTLQIKADITEAKLFNPDFIIANMHWGLEYKQLPSTEQRQLADWLLNQGADLIIGNHPHVIQPMEIRKDEAGVPSRLVVYSLGNFVSNMSNENTDGGAIVKVVVARKGLKRYIASATYGLVFVEHYENERGLDDVRVVPAATRAERYWQEGLPVEPKLKRFLDNSRTLLKSNNIGVEEYFF